MLENLGLWLGSLIVYTIVGAVAAMEGRKQIKAVKAQIPKPPSDETLAQDDLALRDKIQRAVGVAVNSAEERIKSLEKADVDNKKEIGELKSENKQKDIVISGLNRQVARLEGEHENEETKRELAETRAHELDKENVSLKTKLEIYPATLALIEQIITRPIQIILTLEGVIAKEVKTEAAGIVPDGKPKEEEVNL